MPDSISLGPLALPPLVVAALLAYGTTVISMNRLFPSRFSHSSIRWMKDQIPVAVIITFLVWKLSPLFSWWEAIRVDPILLLRIPGSSNSIAAGLVLSLAVILRGSKLDRERLIVAGSTVATGFVSYLIIIQIFTTAFGSTGPDRLTLDSPELTNAVLLSGETTQVFSNDKPTVLTFWATWCGPCSAELPIKEAFYEEHQDEIHYFAVNMTGSESSPAAVLLYVSQNEKKAPVILDQNGTLASAFAVRGTPTTVFIAPDGTVTDRWMGPADLARMNRAVRQVHAR
jgi:thiol-disulfide isomerase/thioredoxin